MGLKNFIQRFKPLDSRIAEKKEIMKKIIEKAKEDDRWSFFEFDYVQEYLVKCEKLNDYDRYEFFFDIAKGRDHDCKFKRATGLSLNADLRDKSSIHAIHRSFLGRMEEKDGIPYNNLLVSIMTDGLINNGHGMQGAFDKEPGLSLTTSPLTSFGELINLVSSYKGNNVVVLLKFPKEMVNEELSFIGDNDIYIRKNNLIYINPEYIMGAIVKNRGSLDEFYTRDEIANVEKKGFVSSK